MRGVAGVTFGSIGVLQALAGLGIVAVTTAASAQVTPISPGGAATRPQGPSLSTGQPRYQIFGTAHRVYGPGNAADLNNIVTSMRYAIRACDRALFEQRQAELRNFRHDYRTPIIDISAAFDPRSYEDQVVASKLLDEIKFPPNCGQPATAAGVGVEVSATGGGGSVDAAGTSYLGIRYNSRQGSKKNLIISIVYVVRAPFHIPENTPWDASGMQTASHI